MGKRCIDCDWCVSDDGYTEAERSKLAIDHHVETGHTVEATGRPRNVRRDTPFGGHPRVTRVRKTGIGPDR